MNAAPTIASCRRSAVAVCIVIAAAGASPWGGATAGAADLVRVQVLWSSAAPAIWQGSIAVEAASVAEFRPLGVAVDEATVFQVQTDRIDVSVGVERSTDGCEFRLESAGTLHVKLSPGELDSDETLSADFDVAELWERPEGTTVRVGDSQLTIRRAPHDRLSVEPVVPAEIFESGAEVVFVSRHRIEKATAVALEWKASLVSLRDGTIAWTEERSSELLAEGEETTQEWEITLPETEGVYRLAVQVYPRRFASRWYRGEAIVTGACDVVVLSDAPPVAEASGQAISTIRPGDSSWKDRVRSASPIRWFGFSEDQSAIEQGAAHVEQEGELSWLVLEPGAVRAFPLPANPVRKSFAVEIDVASGAPGTIEVACRREAPTDAGPAETLETPAGDFWRVAFVIPDLPAPALTASPVETLRVLLPISAAEGTLLVRSADPKRSVRLGEIRVVEELSDAAGAADREGSLTPQSRASTLAIEDSRWPRRLSDGVAPTDIGPPRSARLQWYEAALRLARYAKAEGYDSVSVPAIAEGGAIYPLPGVSSRLMDGPDVAPADVGPPIDAMKLLLSVFDRERVAVILAVSTTEEEAFDSATLTRRWNGLLEQGAGHSSFRGCLLRLPESRFDAESTVRRATTDDFRTFEHALGLTLPPDPALRASFLSRNEGLWSEWQGTRAVRDLEELRFAAVSLGVESSIEVVSHDRPSDEGERPTTVSLFERSGWTLWQRSAFSPTVAPSIAARSVHFAATSAATVSPAPTLGLRRETSSQNASAAFASRTDSAGERRLLIDSAIRDTSGFVDGDAAFAPTFDSELARLRRTLSSLPRNAFASASRRTPQGDEPLRVRTVRQKDGLWVVAINLAPWPIRGTVEFGQGDIGRMRSLSERSLPQPTPSAGGAVWSVDLAPFDVVAARFEGGTAEVADWRTTEPPHPGIDPSTIRAAIDDLSRRLAAAGDPTLRPSLFRETFDGATLEVAGWRVDAREPAKVALETSEGTDDRAAAISPSGTTLRLTSPSLDAPTTRSATVSLIARVQRSPAEHGSGESAATPSIRIVALSGASSITTHVSARVDLAESVASGASSSASEWRQVYVPIDNVPERFWNDWTVTLEVVGNGTLFVDELSILDGYSSPERLSVWRKQLAIAEYALREKRMFAAYEALNSPSMRLVRDRFDLPGAAGKVDAVPHVATAVTAAPVDNQPAPAKPEEERGMIERLWNWRRPEPVFR